MTEQEWLECADYEKMLGFPDAWFGMRKLHLFACGCCRLVWEHLTDLRSRQAVETIERWADDECAITLVNAAQREAAEAYESIQSKFGPGKQSDAAWAVVKLFVEEAAWQSPEAVTWVAAYENEEARVVARQSVASLLRDTVGNPFRPVTINPAWLTPTVVSLAQAIYAERAFDRLPILADALEDAGCDNTDILNHCRQPGEHVRGCWAVDLLLDRE